MSGSITPSPDQERHPAPKFNWRDHLKVHPLADAYPKVPHERLVEIGESIRRNGLKFPIGIHAQGDPGTEVFELFDGVTRLNSMAAVGIKFEIKRFRFGRRLSLDLVIHDVPSSPTTKIFRNLSADEIADEIEDANLHRRHLEPEQYRARIEASHARIKAALEREPSKSDRAHAEELGVSDKTVAKVRKSTAEGSAVNKRIGKDGKARKQPAAKPAKSSNTETENGDAVADEGPDHGVDRDGADHDQGAPAESCKDMAGANGATRSNELLEFWQIATAEEKLRVLMHEGVDGLLELFKGDRVFLSKFYGRVIGLQVALASPVVASTSSKKLLTNLTGTMHWALGQDDPAAGVQGLTIIKAKLSANGREPKDICFNFAKNTRR